MQTTSRKLSFLRLRSKAVSPDYRLNVILCPTINVTPARAAAWVERLCSARRKALARKAASYLRRLSGFDVSFMTKERYHPKLSRLTRPPQPGVVRAATNYSCPSKNFTSWKVVSRKPSFIMSLLNDKSHLISSLTSHRRVRITANFASFFSASVSPAPIQNQLLKPPSTSCPLLLFSGLSRAISAPTTPKAKTSSNGMNMIHQSMGMVEFGKTMLNKGTAGHSRGLKRMD